MASRPMRWTALVLVTAARTVLCTVAALVAWTVVPTALGWSASAIVSGSMEPAVQTGSVVVARPTEPAELKPGHILVADRPGHPGLLAHRMVRWEGDAIVTKGDSNAAEDSDPLPADSVHGVVRLVVPLVGQPQIWWEQGRYAELALAGATLLACVGVNLLGAEPDRRDVRRRGGYTTRDRRRLQRGRHRASRRPSLVRRAGAATVGLTLTAVLAAAVAGEAHAAFSRATANPGNTYSTGAWKSDYGALVKKANPAYYFRLDDTVVAPLTTSAANQGSNTSSGAYSGSVTSGQTGCTPSDTTTSRAVRFTGGKMTGPSGAAAPTGSFAVEAWVRAAGTEGNGKIVGLENSSAGIGDRVLTMTADGTVRWSVLDNGSMVTLSSAPGLNNGACHHLVGAVGADAMSLYVDGVRVATRARPSSMSTYTGSWTVGSGVVSGSGTSSFTGLVDEVAVYTTTTLTDLQIRQHENAAA